MSSEERADARQEEQPSEAEDQLRDMITLRDDVMYSKEGRVPSKVAFQVRLAGVEVDGEEADDISFSPGRDFTPLGEGIDADVHVAARIKGCTPEELRERATPRHLVQRYGEGLVLRAYCNYARNSAANGPLRFVLPMTPVQKAQAEGYAKLNWGDREEIQGFLSEDWEEKAKLAGRATETPEAYRDDPTKDEAWLEARKSREISLERMEEIREMQRLHPAKSNFNYKVVRQEDQTELLNKGLAIEELTRLLKTNGGEYPAHVSSWAGLKQKVKAKAEVFVRRVPLPEKKED